MDIVAYIVYLIIGLKGQIYTLSPYSGGGSIYLMPVPSSLHSLISPVLSHSLFIGPVPSNCFLPSGPLFSL